ncbi:PREDICTED: uncharacterized protein LOC104593553 [Nelumbo nucifera]|uniref:Uncharacterized protein n=2 Tax=Nelumbo nucifera TaxID=4432 RepID=A0A822ZHG6_NELNU|nr:PREDICTED: uncharacterized protein LOC104593553 [Nelumbo nucifera]DAD43111.1 TPA_asm: hypothetical protein HUJ06_001341 [Nelumbo nucifera]
MSQENQITNSLAPENLPVKRKRGRPRKGESLNHGEKVSVTPGSDAERRNRRRKIDAATDTNSNMVGKVVSGVLEGAFDAGYLLTVRVGNTDTILSGVVFEPGLSVPISAANDVAPHVKMFKRNDIPIPGVDSPAQVSHTIQSEQKNVQSVNFPQRNDVLPEKVSPPVNQVLGAPRVLPSELQPGPQADPKGVPSDPNKVLLATLQAVQQGEGNIRSAISVHAKEQHDDVSSIQISTQAAVPVVDKKMSTDVLVEDKTGHPARGVFACTNQVSLVMPQPAIVSEGKNGPASTEQWNCNVDGTAKPDDLLQENASNKGSQNSLDAPEDPKFETKIELSVETLEGTEIPVQMIHVQNQAMGAEFKGYQPIDDTESGPDVKLNHVPVTDIPKSVVAEPIGVLHENQACPEGDTPRDIQAALSVEIPKSDESSHSNGMPQNDATETIEGDLKPVATKNKMLNENQVSPKVDTVYAHVEHSVETQKRDANSHLDESQKSHVVVLNIEDAQSGAKTNALVEMLQKEVCPHAPLDPQADLVAKHSALTEAMPGPQVPSSTVLTGNEDCISKNVLTPAELQSDVVE